MSDGFSSDAAKQAQRVASLKKNRLAALELAPVVARLREEFQQCGIF
ncbi:hypothetical protein [Delftia acidovorans]